MSQPARQHAVPINQPAPVAGEVARRTSWIVLPAYNEEIGLPSLLHKIQQVFAANAADYEVILVDDASTDETARVASQASFRMPLTMVQHPANQGLAGALRTGFETALKVGRPGDVVITMDSDDTHQPGTMNRLLQMIDDGFDVAIASRYQSGSRIVGVARNRLFLTWMARHLFKVVMPINGVRDYTCGFRAYRFEALKMASDHYGNSFVSEPGFSCMADVLLKMRRFKFVMGEVPMLLRYDIKHGDSKMRVRSTAFDTVKLLVKRRLGN